MRASKEQLLFLCVPVEVAAYIIEMSSLERIRPTSILIPDLCVEKLATDRLPSATNKRKPRTSLACLSNFACDKYIFNC